MWQFGLGLVVAVRALTSRWLSDPDPLIWSSFFDFDFVAMTEPEPALRECTFGTVQSTLANETESHCLHSKRVSERSTYWVG